MMRLPLLRLDQMHLHHELVKDERLKQLLICEHIYIAACTDNIVNIFLFRRRIEPFEVLEAVPFMQQVDHRFNS